MMVWLARVVALVALAIFSYWAYQDPKLESIGAACAALVALLVLFIAPTLSATQRQKVSGDSIGVQVGGDFKGSISQASKK